MTIFDRFFPEHLSAYWDRVHEAHKNAMSTARKVNKVSRDATQLLVNNHLSERLELAFELKE